MAKKVFEDEEEKAVEVEISGASVYQPRVKNIVRTLAGFTQGTQDAVEAVDYQLSQYINNGWRLFSTHYMGSDGQGGWFILYVLTKD